MWSPPVPLVAHPDSLAFRSTQKGPVARKPVAPVAPESWTGQLGSCVHLVRVLWSGYPSAEMAFYLDRNALHPKNLNSRWEIKACPFQPESQTGMWGRPAWPHKPDSGSEGPAGTASESLSQPDPSLSLGAAEIGGGEGPAQCHPPHGPCVPGLRFLSLTAYYRTASRGHL